MRVGGIIAGVIILSLMWLAAPANPARAESKTDPTAPHSKEKAEKDKGHRGEHKLTAQEEVGDQDKEWAVFHELEIGFSFLVGWFHFDLLGKTYSFPTKYEWLVLIAAILVAVVY